MFLRLIIILICFFIFFVSLAGFVTLRMLTVQPTSQSFSFVEDKQILVHGQLLKLELAESDTEVQQGLSDRLSMNKDEGMLFFLGDTDIHPFWMHRMHFALDMLWLRDGIVVEIAQNVPPPTITGGIPRTYIPKAEANQVLELTAGGAERYGMKVWDTIYFQ